MTNIVDVQGLVKIYDHKTVVNGISFKVKKGEVFGILGPNGAGKTTTLEMIEGLRPIDGGQAYINGVNVAKNKNKIPYEIGVQPQMPAFQDKTKVHEVINLFASAYGEKVNAKEALDKVNLVEKYNTYTENLSGGQLQRLSIAAALVHKPKVLFMDEPTTGLDPQARRNVWGLVEQVKSQGITVIITTHYMEEANNLCDKVAIMDNGKIVALDKPEKLISNLLKTGFKKKRKVEQADLEDVFIYFTGKELRD